MKRGCGWQAAKTGKWNIYVNLFQLFFFAFCYPACQCWWNAFEDIKRHTWQLSLGQRFDWSCTGSCIWSWSWSPPLNNPTIRQTEWQAKRCLTIVFCFSPSLALWSWGLRLRGLAGFELSISLLRLISLGNPEAPEEPLSVGLCVCMCEQMTPQSGSKFVA